MAAKNLTTQTYTFSLLPVWDWLRRKSIPTQRRVMTTPFKQIKTALNPTAQDIQTLMLRAQNDLEISLRLLRKIENHPVIKACYGPALRASFEHMQTTMRNINLYMLSQPTTLHRNAAPLIEGLDDFRAQLELIHNIIFEKEDQ